MHEAVLSFAKKSVVEPREAAEYIVLLGFARDALWYALALVAIANTFLFFLVLQISGPNPLFPSYFEMPLTLFVLIAGLTVVYVHAMFWAGRAIGGQGSLMDVLAVVVWFQVLRAAAQMVIIVVSVLTPGLAGLLSFVVGLWGAWMFLNFIAAALQLASVWHAIAVLVLAFVSMVLGLGIVMALFGSIAGGMVT